MPFPVPWFAGCGGISVLTTSVLWISVLLVSALLVSALATTALDVSGTSGRTGGMALVMGVAGWGGPAAASFICPALTWTVLTLTGFIRSDEPGTGARAAVRAAKIDREAGAVERTGGAAAGSGDVDAASTAPWI